MVVEAVVGPVAPAAAAVAAARAREATGDAVGEIVAAAEAVECEAAVWDGGRSNTGEGELTGVEEPPEPPDTRRCRSFSDRGIDLFGVSTSWENTELVSVLQTENKTAARKGINNVSTTE